MSRPRRLLRWLAGTAALGAAVAVVFAAAWWRFRARVGEPSKRLTERWYEGHRVLDREGRELRDLPSGAGLRGRSLPLEAMGDRIVLATLAGEDRGFYDHEGIDARAIVRAMGQNLRHGRLVSGASTITEQLVKILDNEGRPRPRTLATKLEEAARAENLEQVLDKRSILEAYLNRLNYGHGLTGPEAATQGYFGVSARDLSWAQAAFLSVLPRAPSYLDPYAHPDRVALRERALLDALRDDGVLPGEDHTRAVDELIAVQPLSHPFLAPHFVEALEAERHLAEGATTRTPLDLDLERDVEGLMHTHLAALAGDGARDAAVLVVDNATGEVLAYVGSASYEVAEIAGNVDMVRALRQPGSTLKPFLYALAFARGHSAADLLADVPTSFPERGGAYSPGNFDGTFEGPISAREALAGSLNVPAIRLAAELPPGTLLDALHTFGFDSLNRDAAFYGLSLALGSGEVSLRELTSAYVALARGGERIPLRFTLEEGAEAGARATGTQVIDPAVAALVTETLSDPLARVRGLHGRGPFEVGFPVALKTGTSSGFRDTWTAGYTRERTVAVWVGNADGAPTHGLTGASGAGPLFAAVIRRAMRDVPSRAPLWEEGLLVEAEVCPLSGKLAGPACPDHATRRFLRGKGPSESCDLHRKARRQSAALSGAAFRCDPRGPETIVVLPEVFDPWLARQPAGAPGQDPFGLPWFARTQTPGCAEVAKGMAAVRVDHPAPGTVFAVAGQEEGATIELRASVLGGDGSAPVGLVEFVVDGRVVGRSPAPYRFGMAATPGDHEVEARPIDATLPVRLYRSRFSVR